MAGAEANYLLNLFSVPIKSIASRLLTESVTLSDKAALHRESAKSLTEAEAAQYIKSAKELEHGAMVVARFSLALADVANLMSAEAAKPYRDDYGKLPEGGY